MDIFVITEKKSENYLTDFNGNRLPSFHSKLAMKKFLDKNKYISDANADFAVIHDTQSSGYTICLDKNFFYSNQTVPQFYKNLMSRENRAIKKAKTV